jgi:hypothetical protein
MKQLQQFPTTYTSKSEREKERGKEYKKEKPSPHGRRERPMHVYRLWKFTPRCVQRHCLQFNTLPLVTLVPSNRVISSLEGKFGTVGETFVLILEPLFMKISNLCKNQFVNGIILKICVK